MPDEQASRHMAKLTGVESVRQVEVPDQPTLYLFEVQRNERNPLLIVWERLDIFSGEDEPPIPFEWPWPTAQAVDALGEVIPAEIDNGFLHLSISLTPVFI